MNIKHLISILRLQQTRKLGWIFLWQLQCFNQMSVFKREHHFHFVMMTSELW